MENNLLNEGDIQKMPKKGYINDQEMLLGLENGYIEGLKKNDEEKIVMNSLRVFVHRGVPK